MTLNETPKTLLWPQEHDFYRVFKLELETLVDDFLNLTWQSLSVLLLLSLYISNNKNNNK